MAGITVALLLCAFQGERVTFSFRDEAVEQVLRIIEVYAGVKVEIAAVYRGRTVSIEAKNLKIPKVIEMIADKLGGAAKKTGRDRYRLAPKWQHALLAKLEKTKAVGLKMEDIELAQALKYFHTLCGVHVHSTVDPKKKIQLTADDVSLRVVLDRIADAAGAKWDLRYGVVYMGNALEKLPIRAPTIGAAPSVPLLLRDKSIEEALTYLQAATGREIKWPEKLPASRVNVNARSVGLDQALALVLYPAGLTAVEKKGVIVVEPRK